VGWWLLTLGPSKPSPEQPPGLDLPPARTSTVALRAAGRTRGALVDGVSAPGAEGAHNVLGSGLGAAGDGGFWWPGWLLAWVSGTRSVPRGRAARRHGSVTATAEGRGLRLPRDGRPATPRRALPGWMPLRDTPPAAPRPRDAAHLHGLYRSPRRCSPTRRHL